MINGSTCNNPPPPAEAPSPVVSSCCFESARSGRGRRTDAWPARVPYVHVGNVHSEGYRSCLVMTMHS